MNYLAHGWRFSHEPYFLAGTSAPDWLSVIDRKMRLRSRRAAEFLEHDDPIYRQFAAGVMQHIADDDWFHQTPAFAELSWQFTVEVRNRLPADDGFRPSFVGHILVELLLDAALAEEDPRRLDDYYAALGQLDPVATQAVINTLATRTSDRVALLIPRFLSERFLYDYLDDGKLLTRLNHVMRRVGLPPLPESLLEFLPAARDAVRKRRDGLLQGTRQQG
jgi:hypothetical protein